MADSHYETGDWIVHAHHGVGQVKGVDRKSLNGIETKYLRVRTKNGVYWLPSENAGVDYIRPVSSGSTFRKALTTIRRPPRSLPKDHKVRAKEISKFLANGALIRMARLIRDLHGRGKTDRLNMSEEDTLVRVRSRFIDEWVIAGGIEEERAQRKLDDALEVSVRKIEDED